jgi:hypothetical protein
LAINVDGRIFPCFVFYAYALGNESGNCPMSLKVFHIIFTGCTTSLFVFLGVHYGIKYSSSGNILNLFFSLSSMGLTVGGVVYGWYFLHKYRHLSNL